MRNISKNKRYISNSVICPYCKSEEKQVIYCKGIEEDTALHIAFAYPADKVAYKEKYCEDCYQECRIAKMLESEDD